MIAESIYQTVLTLYVISPCLCFASPSNPYVRFMSFVSWLPRLMNMRVGYSPIQFPGEKAESTPKETEQIRKKNH